MNETSFNALRTNNPGAVIVWHFLAMPQDQAYLDQAFLFTGGAIASDAVPWVDKATGQLLHIEPWPLPRGAFAHPRSAGTYARVLAQWVRERAVSDGCASRRLAIHQGPRNSQV